MSHLPIEQWLFDEESLTPEESQELQEHLQSCDECYRLAAAWRGVQPLLNSPTMLEPAPDFTARWQGRLALEREALLRRQSIFVLCVSIGGAAVFLMMLIALVIVSFQSPLEWLLAVTAHFVSLLVYTSTLQNVFQVLVEVIPPGWWVGAMAGLAVVCLAWVISLQKLAPSRRIS
jgi:anti-sigma factor RsiW